IGLLLTLSRNTSRTAVRCGVHSSAITGVKKGIARILSASTARSVSNSACLLLMNTEMPSMVSASPPDASVAIQLKSGPAHWIRPVDQGTRGQTMAHALELRKAEGVTSRFCPEESVEPAHERHCDTIVNFP